MVVVVVVDFSQSMFIIHTKVMLSKLTTHKTCQSGQQNLLQLNNFTEFLSSEFFNDIFTNDSIHHVDKKLTQNKFSQPK